MTTATAVKRPPAKAIVKAPDTSAIEKEAILALRTLVQLDTKRTAALKKLADLLVKLRRELKDPAGTSQAYRDAAERIYKAVEVPADSQSSLQASIRYHIGNSLREEFQPAELTKAGLSTKTPLERARDARKEAGSTPGGATNQTQTEEARKASLPGAASITSETPQGPVQLEVIQPFSPPITAASPVKKERRDYIERPRPGVVAVPDPVVLVGHALDSVRSAASLPDIPETEVATLRDMARRMRLELDRLEARLVQSETPAPTPRKRTTAARKTTKAA